MTEETPKTEHKPMLETIMNTPGTKQIGPKPDRKKAADHILRSYADQQETRNPEIMKNFEDSVNAPARSIGERLDEE